MPRILCGLICLGLVSIGQSYLLDGEPVTINDGDGGDSGSCGEPGRTCLSTQASCERNKCRCEGDLAGDGNLHCSDPAHFQCCIKNDPIASTFTGEKFEIPSPCRGLMAYYITYYPDRRSYRRVSTGLNCRVRVHYSGERIKGKIYAAGYDVHMTVTRYQQASVIFKFRGFGVAEKVGAEIKYKFNALVEHDGDDVDAFTNPDVGVGYTLSTNDGDNHRMVLDVAECGLNVVFRPSHPNKGISQPRLPGLCVVVNPQQAGVVNWVGDNGNSLCSAPGGQTMDFYRKSLGMTTVAQAAAKMTFLQTNQWPNYVAQECKPTASLIEDCEEQNPAGCVAAFDKCLFLMSHEHLVKCLSQDDPSGAKGDAILSKFQQCFNAVCYGLPGDCLAVYNDVIDACGDREGVSDWQLTPDFCNAL